MRDVALFVGLALTVGLFATSTAAAGLAADDVTHSVDDRIPTSQETLELLLPAPVHESTISAFDVALPGDGEALEPDPHLLASPTAVADLSTEAPDIDLTPEEGPVTTMSGESSDAVGAITAAEAPTRQAAELPDYVTGNDDEQPSDQESSTTTHGQASSSADTSGSLAEAWNKLDREEKAAATAGALGLLLLGPLTLYSRIQRDDALENDTRREVYEIVEDNPGVCIQEVADSADVSYSTASYHLKRLVRMDYVTRREDGNKVVYYKNGGTFTKDEQDLIPILQNEEAMRVFRHIVENPWCYRAQVAEALDVSHTTVNWHLDRLQEADLVEEHREGRSCHLNVNEESLDRVVSTMDKLEAAGNIETEQAARPKAAPA